MEGRIRSVNYILSNTSPSKPLPARPVRPASPRTEGLFGTTDSVAVGMDTERGLVGRIQLIYLDPDMSTVVAPRLADAFGSPASTALDPAGVEWRNRIRRVWLRRGARFTVNLRDYRYLW